MLNLMLCFIQGVGNILDDVAGTVMGHGVPVARGYLRLERDLPIKVCAPVRVDCGSDACTTGKRGRPGNCRSCL